MYSYKELWNINSSTLSSHYILSIVECYIYKPEKSFILILKPSCDKKKKNSFHFQVCSTLIGFNSLEKLKRYFRLGWCQQNRVERVNFLHRSHLILCTDGLVPETFIMLYVHKFISDIERLQGYT